MRITEDVRRYAAEHGVAEEEGIKRGLEEKAAEYRRTGAGGIDLPQGKPEGTG